MLEPEFVTSAKDDFLFLLKDQQGNLIAAAGWHVDDGLLTGTKECWDVMDTVGKKLRYLEARIVSLLRREC